MFHIPQDVAGTTTNDDAVTLFCQFLDDVGFNDINLIRQWQIFLNRTGWV